MYTLWESINPGNTLASWDAHAKSVGPESMHHWYWGRWRMPWWDHPQLSLMHHGVWDWCLRLEESNCHLHLQEGQEGGRQEEPQASQPHPDPWESNEAANPTNFQASQWQENYWLVSMALPRGNQAWLDWRPSMINWLPWEMSGATTTAYLISPRPLAAPPAISSHRIPAAAWAG